MVRLNLLLLAVLIVCASRLRRGTRRKLFVVLTASK
jgi:hypothetical protein